MQDLCSGSVTLDSFKAVVFVGGFSYADVLGSAKGKYTFILTLTLTVFKAIICNILTTLIRPGRLGHQRHI